MQVEIITIGDEILIGQIVDTNSAWMAQQLNLIGFSVKQISSVSDNEAHILNAFKEASERANVVLITGGLGPTKDDITKNTFCKYFSTHLVLNEAVYSDVEELFKARGKEVSELNRKQAEIPEICTVLRNPIGTAPGMWFDVNNTVYVSMPGVPFEMKQMMQNTVLPMLSEKFNAPTILHHTILTQGIGESALAEIISDWEDNLPSNIKLAYLPSISAVRLRLSAIGEDQIDLQAKLNYETEKLYKLIPQYIYGSNSEMLEEIIGKLLLEKNKTLATAESCTGGKIATLITSVAGCSTYYKGSTVCYSNEIKTDLLGVSPQLLATHGAVSQEVVEAMATGALKQLNVNYTIATSGIAGPSGGSDSKPVGTVWIAVASENKVYSKCYLFGTNRERTIEATSITALNLLRKLLLDEL